MFDKYIIRIGRYYVFLVTLVGLVGRYRNKINAITFFQPFKFNF